MLLILSVVTTGYAQSADQRIADLVNSGDWFALDSEYSQLMDSMHVDFLKLMAEAMIDWKFNQKEKAISNLDELLSKHRQEIGAQASASFEKLLQILKRDLSSPQISRPNRDVAIPFALKVPKAKKLEAWMKPGKRKFKGYVMTVPVTLHGKQHQFIFDTGASRTFIMEQKAKEMGLKILPDTIALNDKQKGLQAFIDSLQVGDITVRNMTVYVGLPNAMDSFVSGIDAVLGMDFINAVGETQILFNEGKFVFPYEFTPMPETGRNLLIDNTPQMKATKDGQTLVFVLDTSNTMAELYAPYRKKFQTEVDSVAEPDTVTTGSYGHVSTVETLFLPNGISFEVGNTPVTIDEISIFPDTGDALQQNDGRMGMDLIHRFRKTTINLKDMFVKFEQ